MNLKKLLLVNNDCYKSGKKITPKGIMVHSTGANNKKLSRYVAPDDGCLGKNTNNNHWNMSGVGACVHAFIGVLADGTVATYQTLPWNMRGWHCAGAGNNTHISFEICEDNLTDAKYFRAVFNEAVELCAYLCEEYKLNPLTDIICHSEGHKKGIASNHADVMHWFPKHGESMNSFRNAVKAKIDENKGGLSLTQYEELKKENEALKSKIQALEEKQEKVYHYTMEIPEYARPTIQKMLDKGILKGESASDLNLTESLVRAFVIMERAGVI